MTADSLRDLLERVEWPAGGAFRFHDDPSEHDPCYVIMPGGAMLAFNHDARPGVDIARAKFVQAACNGLLAAMIEQEGVSRSQPCADAGPSPRSNDSQHSTGEE